MLKVETSTMICCTWLIDSCNIAKEVSHIAGEKNTNIWARHAHVKTRRFRRNRCCKGAKLRGQFSPLPSFFTYHEINDRYLIVKDRIKALIKGSNHYIKRIIFHCSMSEHLPLNNISTCKESR